MTALFHLSGAVNPAPRRDATSGRSQAGAICKPTISQIVPSGHPVLTAYALRTSGGYDQ